MQHTLARSVTLTGVGLHSGRNMTMRMKPAAAGTGIVFVRTDLDGQPACIPALWDRVADTQLCTVIANEDGASVGTVEHVMAALRGCGVDNLEIELDGPEVPVMDGSAQPFVEAVTRAGLREQERPRRAIRILKDVTVRVDDKHATLKPGPGSVFGGVIDFDHPEIGTQSYKTALVNGNFVHEIARCRTFGFADQVAYLRTQGLALGGSLENAIVLSESAVMNEGGLRYKDEFIRHKLLDAIGDLYLAGGIILGEYEGHKAGHALNNALLHALFADETAWEYVEMNGGSGEDAALADVSACVPESGHYASL